MTTGQEAPRLRLRIDLAPGAAIGPGKVRLMELIREEGSIAAAGRRMGMSYRRAWRLVDALNGTFNGPLVEAQPGGSGGGGAVLTPLGLAVIERYRTIEALATKASASALSELSRDVRRA